MVSESKEAAATIQQDGHVWAWHIHHNVLLGPILSSSYSLEGRIKYIKESKPPSEQKLRLRLLQLVRAELPAELIAVRIGCWVGDLKARLKVYKKVQQSLEIQALHVKECPDCPWDGNTILPRRE